VSKSDSIIFFAADRRERGTHVPLHLGVFTGADQSGSRRRNRIVELYDSVRPSLFGYLCCIGLCSSEAEDVIQESFLRLVKHFSTAGEEQNLRGWLFRVAHNLAMDLFRSVDRSDTDSLTEVRPLILEQVDRAMNPEEKAVREEQLQQLQVAMSWLTTQQRYAVLLRAEGLRYREIAAVLGISPQGVANLIQRALTRLAGGL
jgi:RNA polymerase sigma-70 factor, ECF subfamily